MAIIIPAAVIATPAVCHMMCAKREEEETKTRNKSDCWPSRSFDSQKSSRQEEDE